MNDDNEESIVFCQEDNLNIIIERGIAEGVNKNSEADEIYDTIMKVLTNDR
jgi:hypothetical protein